MPRASIKSRVRGKPSAIRTTSLRRRQFAAGSSPSATGIPTPVLVLNGADDTSVTDTHIAAFEKEMDALGADWQFVDFGGARHCFSQPEDRPTDPVDNCRYDERAARRAMTMLHAFFRERFASP